MGTNPTAGSVALTEPQVAHFIRTAFDVRVGQLALEKSNTKPVRELAEMMIKDHLDMVKEQDKLLNELGITPEDSAQSRAVAKLSADRRAELATFSGTAFDHAFAHAEVDAHRKIAEILQNVLIPAATTPRYKTFLIGALDTIREHEKHCERLVATLG